MSKQSKIIIPDFAPTEDQIEFRKAIAHRVHPIVVGAFCAQTNEVNQATAKAAAQVTMMFVDALIEKLEE